MPTGSRSVRIASLLLACALLSSGCAALLTYSGQNVGQLANAEQVHNSFGTPARQGSSAAGTFAEYHTRRKISEGQVAGGCMVADLQTLGLSELVLFPFAVARTIYTTLAGQQLRFEYDESGVVKEVLIDGTPISVRFNQYFSLPK